MDEVEATISASTFEISIVVVVVRVFFELFFFAPIFPLLCKVSSDGLRASNDFPCTQWRYKLRPQHRSRCRASSASLMSVAFILRCGHWTIEAASSQYQTMSIPNANISGRHTAYSQLPNRSPRPVLVCWGRSRNEHRHEPTKSMNHSFFWPFVLLVFCNRHLHKARPRPYDGK